MRLCPYDIIFSVWEISSADTETDENDEKTASEVIIPAIPLCIKSSSLNTNFNLFNLIVIFINRFVIYITKHCLYYIIFSILCPVFFTKKLCLSKEQIHRPNFCKNVEIPTFLCYNNSRIFFEKEVAYDTG